MAKEEDIIQANAGSPAANIPDLKKKEKERKKAGAAWRGTPGAAGDFSGAVGGSGAAGAAASAAASAAAEGAGLLGAEAGGGFFAGIMRFLAGLAGTLLGKLAMAAAAFLMMAAAGLLGYEMMKGKGGDASVGTPNLGGIADSLHVHEGGDDRTGVDSKGDIRFDPLTAAKPAATAPPTDVKAAGATPGGAPDVAADSGQKPVPTDCSRII